MIQQQWLDGQEGTCRECGAAVVYEDGVWFHKRIDSGTHAAEPIVEEMTMIDREEMKCKDLEWVWVVRKLWDDGSDNEDVFLHRASAWKVAEHFAETHLLSAYEHNDELYSEWSRTDGQMSVSVRMSRFSAK